MAQGGKVKLLKVLWLISDRAGIRIQVVPFHNLHQYPLYTLTSHDPEGSKKKKKGSSLSLGSSTTLPGAGEEYRWVLSIPPRGGVQKVTGLHLGGWQDGKTSANHRTS